MIVGTRIDGSRHARGSRHSGSPPRHSRHPFVNPAPHSSFRRRPESRGVGGGKTAASLRTKACPGLRSRMNGSRHRIRHSADRRPAPYPVAGPESRRGVNGFLPLHLGEGWGEGQGRNPGEAWEAPITLEHFRKLPAKAGIQKGWGGVRPPDDGKNSLVAPFSSSYAAFARP